MCRKDCVAKYARDEAEAAAYAAAIREGRGAEYLASLPASDAQLAEMHALVDEELSRPLPTSEEKP
jgi:hypothetical protein